MTRLKLYRRFYELEAAGTGWSVRELERPVASSLCGRLALSRDKARAIKQGMMQRLLTGQPRSN